MSELTERKKINRIIEAHLLKRGLTDSEIKRILGERRNISTTYEKLNLIIKA